MSAGLDESGKTGSYMAEPPVGQIRYESDIPSSATAMNVVGIASSAFGLIVVSLRIYTKLVVTKCQLATDDCMLFTQLLIARCAFMLINPDPNIDLIIASITFAVAELGIVIWLSKIGFGFHWWQVTVNDYSPGFLVGTTLGTSAYALAVITAKLSILVYYLQISPENGFRRLVLSCIAITISYATAYVLLSVFSCIPVASAWNITIPSERCVNKLAVYTSLGIMNIIMDFIVLLLPVRIVWALQMPKRQKVHVILIFSTGLFVCICAIKRQMMMPSLMSSSDYTWEVPEQMVWAFTEINAGIACACFPVLKAFYRRFLPQFIGPKSLSNDAESGNERIALSTVVESNRQRRVHGTSGTDSKIVPTLSRDGMEELEEDEQELWSNRHKVTNHVSSEHDGKQYDVGGEGIWVTKKTEVSYRNP